MHDMTHPAHATARRELIAFRIGPQEFCVDIMAVREIRGWTPTTPLPHAPSFIRGVVNLRGAVLPVVDLRTRLELPRVERDERQRIVVLIVGGVRTGFVVDSVAEVARVAAGQLEPAPQLSAQQAEVVTRVANLPQQQRMLLVLEPQQLLGAEQVALLAGSAQAAEVGAGAAA